MIYGVGTDLVEIDRVIRAIDRNDSFLGRFYTEREREFLEGRGKHRGHSAAMNFAGKEAVSKALGTGISTEVRLNQIEILRKPSGAPYVVLHDETERYAQKCGVGRIHISLSDTDILALAYAVAESIS